MSRSIDYFSSENLRKDLKGKTVRGGLWTASSQACIAITTLLSVPIMARLLDPADFGLVAMVTALTAFASMFVDVGLSTATMQRRDITHYQVSNLFWIGAGLGTFISIFFAFLSPAIAWFYDEPRLTAITLALCPTFFFAGLTMQVQALLQRAMRFRILATIQVLAVGSSFIAGIAIAWWYRSYWAMVAIPLVMATVRLIGTWSACKWWPALPRRGTGVWELLTFGGYVTGFRLLTYFSRNADNILIGWYWGATLLGFYERAYKLLLFPLRQINAPLSGVAVSALSRVAAEPKLYRRGYASFLELVAMFAMPLGCFVLVTPDLCVHIFLSPKWSNATPIFAWLAIVAIFQPVSHTFGWLFISQGRGREMFLASVVGSFLTVSSFLVGLPWGPTYVAAAYALSGLLLRFPFQFWWATRTGPVRPRDLLNALAVPLMVSFLILVTVSLLRGVLRNIVPIAEFGACLMVALLCVLTVLFATQRGQIWLNLYGKLILDWLRERKRA